MGSRRFKSLISTVFFTYFFTALFPVSVAGKPASLITFYACAFLVVILALLVDDHMREQNLSFQIFLFFFAMITSIQVFALAYKELGLTPVYESNDYVVSLSDCRYFSCCIWSTLGCEAFRPSIQARFAVMTQTIGAFTYLTVGASTIISTLLHQNPLDTATASQSSHA